MAPRETMEPLSATMTMAPAASEASPSATITSTVLSVLDLMVSTSTPSRVTDTIFSPPPSMPEPEMVARVPYWPDVGVMSAMAACSTYSHP